MLCLDCATKTGWSIYNDGKLVESGVQDFKKKRGESNGMLFLKFRKWLTDLSISSGRFDLIVYEQASHRGGAATEICVNLTGRVQEFAEEHAINFSHVRPSELKKHATGKGNAGKPEMMDAAEFVLGRAPLDDNEADAVLMGEWAVEEFGA